MKKNNSVGQILEQSRNLMIPLVSSFLIIANLILKEYVSLFLFIFLILLLFKIFVLVFLVALFPLLYAFVVELY